MNNLNTGIVKRIIGPVIDIKFEDSEMPQLLDAIKIKMEDHVVVAEVAQHVGDSTVRCIALSSTDGMKRGLKAINTEFQHQRMHRKNLYTFLLQSTLNRKPLHRYMRQESKL